MHRLQHQLAAIDRAFPYQRKLLICPDVSFGRELLASLARSNGSWVGWEITTLRAVAESLSLSARARRRIRKASDIEVAGVVDRAIDTALADNSLHASLVQLSADQGTRKAVFDALQELRMGAVQSSHLRATAGAFSASLSRTLDAYCTELERRALTDSAGLFQMALDSFDEEFPLTYRDALLFVAPSWPAVGLPGQLRDRLITAGARPLDVENEGASERLHIDSAVTTDCTDKIHEPRHMEFFHAATASDELLFVLREALARGARFDDVEIACANVDSYGVALDAICRRTGVAATMLEGVPLMATRVGRAVGRMLDWLESGFNADVLRRALEAGDFAVDGHTGAALAKELRRARTGWGRDQTDRIARRLFASAASTIEADATRFGETTSSAVQMSLPLAAQSNSTELSDAVRRRALAVLLLELLERAPMVRDATHASDIDIRCADVARGLCSMLDRLAVTDVTEESTLARVSDHLDDIADGIDRVMPSAHALAFVRASLSELRAWTSVSNTARPRRATGGHVHLTDLAHAGTTGRQNLFIVGLDSENVAGPVVQSSLLPDAIRSRFPDSLRTTEQRRRMRTAQIEQAIASSSARLCLSYAIAIDAEGAERSPSYQLLDTWRRSTGRHDAGYDDLRDAMGPVRSAVPLPDDTPVDSRDLWLQIIQDPDDHALLRNAETLVRAHHPAISRGLDAGHTRAMPAGPTAWHGMVPKARALDPRLDGREISPSSLEAFAACPMRWFYRDALGAYAPRDLQYDEARWLDAAQRGSLLHDVFDSICRQRLHEHNPAEESVSARAIEILRAATDKMCATVPSPGAAIYEAEVRQLEEDVRFFLFDEHERWQQEPWELVEGEMRFGGDRRVAITLDDGTQLHIRGRVDRVDRTADGLRIIDYKTGKTFFDWNDRIPFAGGRKLQLAVYAAAASQVVGEPVVRAEYRFSTASGGGTDLGVDADLMPQAMRVVNGIVNEIASGRFLPTFDRSDCSFCDYADICRSVPGLYGPDSPRARWGSDNSEREEYRSMREWRAKT